jgi:hypothetical protein
MWFAAVRNAGQASFKMATSPGQVQVVVVPVERLPGESFESKKLMLLSSNLD